jgi:nucleotide-binding universal stress UspA family protein
MFSHVLVPLDGSALAEYALPFAQQMLGEGSKLSLLTVIQLRDVLPYSYYPLETYYSTSETAVTYERNHSILISEAKDYLEDVAKRIRETAKFAVDVDTMVGNPAEVITQVARDRAVEAIVMSTHGRSGIGRWLFGSVTLRVLEAAPCPVLVIPSQHFARESEAQIPESHYG